MVNFKEHLKLTGLYTFFAAFPALLQLVVYPVIEGNDRLNAEQFGYLAIAEAVLSFLVMYILYGMAITISRYYFDVKDDRQKYKKLVSTIFTGILLRGLILLAGILLAAPYVTGLFGTEALDNIGEYGHYLVIIAFSRTVMMVALALYRNEKRIKMFVIASLLAGIARSLFQMIGVLWFDMSFVGYLAGTALGSGLVALFVIILVYAECGFHYSRDVRRSLSGYAFPLFLTDLVVWGFLFVDRFFLLNNPDALGIYDNALKFAMGVQFISQGLASSVQPELFRLFGENSEESRLNIKTQSNLFIAENIVSIAGLLIPVMLFITLFYETSLVLSASLLPILFVRFILYAQYQVFLWPLLYLKRSSVFLYVSLAAFLLVLLINYLLVPLYGYYGAVIASIAGYGLQVAGFHYFQHKWMPIAWNRVKVLWFPLGIVVLAVVLELIKIWLGMHPFLAASILVVAAFAGLLGIYRREFKGMVKKYLRLRS